MQTTKNFATPSLQSNLPEHKGELDFAQRVLEVINPDAKVWFNPTRPTLPEVDCYIVDPEFGTFIIEVKAVSLEAIIEYSPESCMITGRPKGTHPISQALLASYKYREKFDELGLKKPWLQTTAAFPKISRKEFIKKFCNDTYPDSEIRKQHAYGILFQEDLSSPDNFRKRLLYVSKTPPRGIRRPKQLNNHLAIEELKSAQKLLGSADRAGIPIIFESAKKWDKGKESIKRFLTPSNRGNIVISGKAGTGKTRALIDIAVSHAEQDRYVLFTCFNKVLATEIDSLINSYKNVDGHTKGRIIVTDIYNFHNNIGKINFNFENFFHTICIDESQDLVLTDQDDNLNLLSFLSKSARNDAEWFFAYSKDQLLYGKTPKPVEQILATHQREGSENFQRLSRPGSSAEGYRNSIIAYSMLEANLSAEKAVNGALKRIAGKASMTDTELQSTMQNNKSSLVKPLSSYIEYYKISQSTPIEFYKYILLQELIYLKSVGKDNDLLIMFPLKNSSTRFKVIEALDQLGISYLDQVVGANRRTQFKRGEQVRLTTIHSSRGIEATRAILFDAHDVWVKDNTKFDQWVKIPSYIALSRAIDGTKVYSFIEKENSPLDNFLIDFTAEYHRIQEKLIK
ncbi:hypothetical protein [Rothia nasimurium]|uniref:hypothetical protein n=1 Tax=Rothia nasimurium TaxID=85336 RepID=UPI001F1829EA|nr:hypothetical protein [Rothia nasimurium]